MFKVTSVIVFLFYSTNVMAINFWDLRPIPILGKKWEVTTNEKNKKHTSVLEYIEVSDNDFVIKSTTNNKLNWVAKFSFKLKNGKCYFYKMETGNLITATTQKPVYNQATVFYDSEDRCYVSASEMPYKNKLARHIKFSTGELSKEQNITSIL